MPNFKRMGLAAAVTAALVCAPLRPAAAAGPLLFAAPWALGHIVAGLARWAVAATVTSAVASAYAPGPSAPGYGYGGPYGAAPPAYYPSASDYSGYGAPPGYYPQPGYYAGGYAYPYAAPPGYYRPAASYYYPARGYYRASPWYSRGAYEMSRGYRGLPMRYSRAYGARLSYRTHGFYRRR